MDPLGRLLAHFGMRVVATDISPAAVEFQNSEISKIDPYVEQYELGPEVEGGSFRAVIHDFRTPFTVETFDMIYNLNAFQHFPPADLRRIAEVHAGAMRPARVAVIDGVEQVERQEAVEEALESAGFFIRMLRYNRRLRQLLNNEDITYAYMWMGYQSFQYLLSVRAIGEFADEDRRAAALKRLSEIQQELASFRQDQIKDENEAMTEKTKCAEVLII